MNLIHTPDAVSSPVTSRPQSRGFSIRKDRKPNLKGGWLDSTGKERSRLASNFTLDGGMIPRSEQRSIDERSEARYPAASGTAVLEFRGRKHVIRLANVSRSGAMVIFPHTPNIGEQVAVHLLDRGLVTAQVIWVKDGRIGLSFMTPLE